MSLLRVLSVIQQTLKLLADYLDFSGGLVGSFVGVVLYQVCH